MEKEATFTCEVYRFGSAGHILLFLFEVQDYYAPDLTINISTAIRMHMQYELRTYFNVTTFWYVRAKGFVDFFDKIQ